MKEIFLHRICQVVEQWILQSIWNPGRCSVHVAEVFRSLSLTLKAWESLDESQRSSVHMGRQNSWFSVLERNGSSHISNRVDNLMDMKLRWAGKSRLAFASNISITQPLQNVIPALENPFSFSKNPSRKHLHKSFQMNSFLWVPNTTKLATTFAKLVWF